MNVEEFVCTGSCEAVTAVWFFVSLCNRFADCDLFCHRNVGRPHITRTQPVSVLRNTGGFCVDGSLIYLTCHKTGAVQKKRGVIFLLFKEDTVISKWPK